MSLGLRWTRHATDEAANDGLLAEEVEEAPAVEARIIEANPQDARGASTLVLAHLSDGTAVHALIGHGQQPWAVITVYIPDPARWNSDYTERG